MSAPPAGQNPQEPPTRPSRANFDLLLLAGIVVLINLPYLDSHFVPGHDTRSPFTMFSYFYNHVFIEHELPLWMVYGDYGFRSAPFQFTYLTGSSYLAMAGGVVFGVRDPLTVFTISIVGEQLVLLLGVYLLSKRLFSDRLTVLLVCLGAIFGTVWYWQIFFNFRVFYALPLTLYFLFRFTSEHRPEFLWMTGISVLLGTLGSPPYFYPLHALVLILIALGLGKTFWKALPCLKQRSWRNGAGFAVLVLIASVIGLTLSQALAGIRIDATGRDPGSSRVPLAEFLVYGGHPSARILASFLGILPRLSSAPDYELTHFIGLLPLAALPVAVLRCRSPYFISMMIAAAGLLLLAQGGLFASLVYRLPLISYFRHIGYVTTLAKILLLFAAGFGIDRILSALSTGLDWNRNARLELLATFLLALVLVAGLDRGVRRLADAISCTRLGDFGAPPILDLGVLGLRLAACLVAAVAVLWPSRTLPGASAFRLATARKALLAAMLLDGLWFQSQVAAQRPQTHDPVRFRVGAFPFHARREDSLDRDTERRLEEWKIAGIQGAEYHLCVCAIFQLDPFKPLARPGGWSSEGVAALREARKAVIPDPALQAVLGATLPKLRLVSDAVFVETLPEATKRVAESRALETTVVLRNVPRELQLSGPGDPGPAAGDVRVKSFSANRLVAEATVTRDAPVWLVYADAIHPGWRASVNGKDVPMAEAYLAFKAVRLEKGLNTVEFTFHDGLRTIAQKALGLLALLGSLSAFVALGVLIVRDAGPPSTSAACPGSA